MPSPRAATAAFVAMLVAGCGARTDLPDPTPAARARAAAIVAAPAAVPVAPPAQDLQALGRGDCLRLALANNRPFRIRRSGLSRAADGRIVAESAVYAPKLTASYTIANRDPDTGVGHVGVAVPAYGFVVEPFVDVDYLREASAAIGAGTYQTQTGVRVSRRLFAIAEHRAQRLPITAADKEYLAAANGVVLERKRVELAVAQRFFNLQRAQARRRVRASRVDDAREFLRAVQDNVRLGFKAPVEELQASISLNQAEADLLSESTSVRENEEQLLQLLALPVSSAVDIVEEDLAGVQVASPPLDADVARLQADHEELGNALLDIRLELEQLAIQRDQTWPDLTASVVGENRRTGTGPYDGSIADEDIVALTLSYSMPLDLSRGPRARFRQMDAEIAEKRLQLDELRNDLEARLRSAHRRIDQLGVQVGLAERRLEAERGKMEVTLARYRAGTIDNLEVTRAKQDLDNAEIGLGDARVNLVLADAEYRSLLPAPIAPPDAPPVDRPAPIAPEAPRP